uniref:53-BP1_Tudor domain-containing protein n=1 Tax=Glossina brevipalpis TaxID=37001 RepID=A0A1A9WW90_9MUSC
MVRANLDYNKKPKYEERVLVSTYFYSDRQPLKMSKGRKVLTYLENYASKIEGIPCNICVILCPQILTGLHVFYVFKDVFYSFKKVLQQQQQQQHNLHYVVDKYSALKSYRLKNVVLSVCTKSI